MAKPYQLRNWEYAQRNKAKIAAMRKAYRKAHPEKVTVYQRNNSLRKYKNVEDCENRIAILRSRLKVLEEHLAKLKETE